MTQHRSPIPLPRFVCKNNGVLFENQLLQIGVKSEFRQNLGKWRGHEMWGGVGQVVHDHTWPSQK